MLVPNRQGSTPAYRYGFNGMEKDDELKGEGNSYDFGSRIHDSRIGRFLSLDPLQASFPNLSPYVYAANSPIIAKDEDGKFANIIIKYGIDVGINIVTQMLTAYMFNDDVKTMGQAWDEVSILSAMGEGVVDQLGGKKLKMAANATMGIVNYLDQTGLENATVKGALTAGGIGLLEPILGEAVTKYGLKAVTKGLKKLGLDCKTIEKITAELACFEAGTLISTSEGFKPIESVTESDLVWSFNEETGKAELKKVLQTYSKEVTQVLEIITTNEVIVVTEEHPFYVNGVWVRAKDLKVGNSIKTNSEISEIVLSLTLKDKNIIVYNFEVEGNHNYYVAKSKLLVHNECGPKKGDAYGRLENIRDSSGKNITELNHLPSKQAYKLAGIKISSYSATAHVMEKIDHRAFITTGSSLLSKAFRQQEARLIKAGKFEEAFDFGVAAIRKQYGSKYDKALAEAKQHYMSEVVPILKKQLKK